MRSRLNLANDALSASEADLKALHQTLERRVRERTADLETQRKFAEAASEAKSRFLAMMGHELRTPLNAIIGFSEIMKGQLLGPLGKPQYLEYTKDIHMSGINLLGTINDFLLLSKIETNTQALNLTRVKAAPFIQDCSSQFSAKAANARIELITQASGIAIEINIDALKLKRALTALLDNAIKFTLEHGRVELRLEAEANGGVTFVIVDTGRGMAPAEIPIALSVFGQVDDSLARQYEGAGLGLPLVTLLIELHGGTLAIESTSGKGTTVRVHLPEERVIQGESAV